MSHFQTRVKNFFAIRENFFSRRPFGRGQLVGANGFMRLFDPTVKHFSAKKFAVLPPLLTDCSINTPERQAKFPENFFAAFPFAPLLSSPNIGCSSPASGKKQFFQQKGCPYTRLVPPMPEQGFDEIFLP